MGDLGKLVVEEGFKNLPNLVTLPLSQFFDILCS